MKMKILEPLIAASLLMACVAAWADEVVTDDSYEVAEASSPEKVGDSFAGVPDKVPVREDSATVVVASPDSP
jgi:hypothetical protein